MILKFFFVNLPYSLSKSSSNSELLIIKKKINALKALIRSLIFIAGHILRLQIPANAHNYYRGPTR